MGVGQTYGTLSDAVAAAQAGDTISIAPGTYVDQTADITVPLSIIGNGAPGSIIFTASPDIGGGYTKLANDKGFLIIDASATIDNLTFQNATADPLSANGAGIRYQAGDLTVRNSRFINNQDGILATPGVAGTGSILVSNSAFLGNGVAEGLPGAGFAHAIYATQVALLNVSGSRFDGTLQGHDIKSRALDTIITDNLLNDGVTGDSSYAIDLPNGGDATITGNTINQGDNSPNWTMIAYAAEDLAYDSNTAMISGNVFNNTLPTAFGVNNFATGSRATHVTVSCNAFNNVSDPSMGPVTFVDNVINGPLPACGQTSADVPEPKGPAALLPGLLAVLILQIRRRQQAAPVRAD